MEVGLRDPRTPCKILRDTWAYEEQDYMVIETESKSRKMMMARLSRRSMHRSVKDLKASRLGRRSTHASVLRRMHSVYAGIDGLSIKTISVSGFLVNIFLID